MKHLFTFFFLIISVTVFAQDYDSRWSEVYENELNKHFKSANEKVLKIYNQAVLEKNDYEIVKTFFYRNKFKQTLESFDIDNLLWNLDKEINQINQPYKSILQTYKAKILIDYYSNSSYRIKELDKIKEPYYKANIGEWRSEDFLNEITRLQNAVFTNEAILKNTHEPLKDLVNTNENIDIRNYDVYELLCFEWISIFEKKIIEKEDPSAVFLKASEVLDFSNQFSSYNFPDPFSKVLSIYQKLEFYYESKNDLLKLDQIRLKRYQNFSESLQLSFEVKDQLLSNIFEAMKTKKFQSKVILQKVNLWYNYGKLFTNGSNNVKAKLAWAKTVEYILSLKQYELTKNEVLYINTIYEVITDKKTQTNLPKYLLKNTIDKGLVRLANTDTLFTRFYRVSDEKTLSKLKNDSLKIDFIYNRKPDYEKITTSLNAESDHFEKEYEFLIDGINKGIYLVLTSPNQQFNPYEKYFNFHEIIVTDLVLFSKAEAKSVDFYFLDRKTGMPFKKHLVKINGKKYRTNDLGIVSMKKSKKLIDEDKVKKTDFLIQFQDEEFLFEELHDFDDEELLYNYQNKDWREEKEVSVNFITDRSLYRPGQQIHFKGILLDLDFVEATKKTLPNIRLMVIANDNNGIELFKKEFITNEFGSFADSLTIPKTTNISKVDLTLQKPEKLSKKEEKFWDEYGEEIYSGKTLFVEEYKRPTFSIELDDFKEDVYYGKDITLKGKVLTYAKTPISNAKVETTINFSENGSKETYYYKSETLLDTETVTDVAGNFSVTFKLKQVSNDSLKFQPNQNYSIRMNVKDASGEVRSTFKNIYVNHNDLNLSWFSNEKIPLNSDVELNIKSTNANGKIKPISGLLEIVRYNRDNRYFKNRLWNVPEKQLISEDTFRHYFPYESYTNKDHKVLDSLKVYSKKIEILTDKSFIIKKSDWLLPGSYEVRFIPDEKYNSEMLTSMFSVLDPEAVPENKQVVALSLEDTKIENNELSIKVNSVFDNVLVFMQVQQNYTILPKTSFVATKGLSEIKVPILNKNIKEVYVKYYYVYDNRFYEESVYQDFTLKAKPRIKTEIVHLKNRLLPGTKEQILLKVNNENNQSFNGEMVAGMYDLSIEGLMNNNNRYSTEWNFYTGYFSFREEFSELYYDSAINRKNLSKVNWSINLNSKLDVVFPSINTFGFDLYRNYATQKAYYDAIKYNVLFTDSKSGLKQLSGVVVTDDGDPIPGATLLVLSSNRGTETDLEGKFQLFVTPDTFINVNYEGFKPVTFLAQDFKGVVTMMEDDLMLLDEIVVDTYRTTSQSLLSSDVVPIYDSKSSVNKDDIEAEINGTIIKFDFSNKAETTVILRGMASISNNVEPLYVVDGIPVSAERFRSLAFDDISNISLLKDSDATAIYGNRGANGVIMISTKKGNLSDMSDVKIRKNLKETAFFYPFVYPDKNNLYEINYTVPESLTEWKFRALTHNKNADVSYLETNVFTQKDVTIQPNMPRFLRENDEVMLRARVSNVSEDIQKGKVFLQLKNALTEEIIDDIIISENLQDVQIEPNSSTFVEWKVKVPSHIQGLQYVVSIKTNDYSDGEQAIIPVLSKKQFVSENVSIWQLGNSIKSYHLTELNENDGKVNLNLNVQATTNGLWLMMNKLPYLLNYEHECTEQLMSTFFATQLSLKIIEENKDIQNILSKWNEIDVSKWDNDDYLKEIIEKESPWLKELWAEKDQNKKFAESFNKERLIKSSQELLRKIILRQNKNGGFGWFSEETDDFWITLQMLQTLKQLDEFKLFVLNEEYQDMTKNAISYLDRKFLIEKDLKNVSNQELIDFLYIRSYFKSKLPLEKTTNDKWNLLLEKVNNKWLDANLEFKSKAAIVFSNENKESISEKIIDQLRESSVLDESKGMYWKNDRETISFWHTDAESQAFAIEAFVKNNAKDSEIQSLKARLISQSNYDNFGSTKTTSQAIYSFLLGNKSDKSTNAIQIVDKKSKELFAQDALLSESGIHKVMIEKDAITSNLNTLTINNQGQNAVIGSINYNYLQDLDKVVKTKNSDQPFLIEKGYFKEIKGEKVIVNDKNELRIGDEIWIRLKFSTKENASYIHIKDERAATFEPFFELSGIRYERNLRYYFKGNDASTNFFIDYLPIGEHILWYRVKVNNIGKFTDGLVKMQSMYAPQYQAHSKGTILEVLQ